jgi:hypothetical protein
MDEITFAVQYPIDGIGQISADLAHPQPLGIGGNTGDLYLACQQLDKKEHKEALQSPSGPYLHGEEIRSHNQFPMSRQEILSRRLSPALRRWFQAVPFQNVSNRAPGQFVAQIAQRARDATVTPILILFRRRPSCSRSTRFSSRR